MDYVKLIVLGIVALLAAVAANWAHDLAYQVHAILIMLIAGGLFLWQVRQIDEPKAPDSAFVPASLGYMDGPIRYGVIATAFWGIAGFLVGTFIAFQLAFPVLNFDWSEGYLNFGRLRPLHTSAVIFAFGGNALIATSFYVVQRTSGTRLWGGDLAWFVFWGYNLFIVIAATGYLLGATQSKEYAEPEWYADIWLTIVWVAYLVVYMGTLMTRKERHIYVANWFFLAFIVTVALLHVMNNLSIPVSIFGSRSIQVFSGVQDAMVQWWYGHNAVGFFLTAGFLGMMYYFVPKQAGRPVYSYKLSIIHFWALIFLYIWAGPHHLHYTALPDWASTLGMVFSIVLWMPSWGGMINGLMTLEGAWDKIRTDPIIRMFVASLAFYGMSTFEGPMMSIRAVNSPVALHRLDHRPRAFGRARLERSHHLRLPLLPDAKALGPSADVLGPRDQPALLARDRGDRPLRLLDVGHRHHGGPDVARGRRQRLPRELLRRHRFRQVPDVRGARSRRCPLPHRRADHGLEHVDDHPRAADLGASRSRGVI